jgi:hypothetical protein
MNKRINMDDMHAWATRLEDGEVIVVMAQKDDAQSFCGQLISVNTTRGLNESSCYVVLRVWQEIGYPPEEKWRPKTQYYARPSLDESYYATITPDSVVELVIDPEEKSIVNPYTQLKTKTRGMYMWSE